MPYIDKQPYLRLPQQSPRPATCGSRPCQGGNSHASHHCRRCFRRPFVQSSAPEPGPAPAGPYPRSDGRCTPVDGSIYGQLVRPASRQYPRSRGLPGTGRTRGILSLGRPERGSLSGKNRENHPLSLEPGLSRRLFFDIDLDQGWQKVSAADFAGSSHDKITEEVYIK